jgi:hypothetical protein
MKKQQKDQVQILSWADGDGGVYVVLPLEPLQHDCLKQPNTPAAEPGCTFGRNQSPEGSWQP